MTDHLVRIGEEVEEIEGSVGFQPCADGESAARPEAEEPAAAEPARYELQIARWEGRIRCAYLNDYRIAGGKPWGGFEPAATWHITLADIEGAIPAIGEVRASLAALVDRDLRYDGNCIVIQCEDHGDAIRRAARARAAIARATGSGS